jgi:hypothetical protein
MSISKASHEQLAHSARSILSKSITTIDIEMKQHAVIEFLFLERSDGEEIIQRLRNIYGDEAYSHAAIFRWIKEVWNSNEEFYHEEGLVDHIDTKLARKFGTSLGMIRLPRCVR